MPLVFLRTGDGRFLVGGVEGDSSFRVVAEPQDCFEWEEGGDGGPRLRSLLSGRYLETSAVTAETVVLPSGAHDLPSEVIVEPVPAGASGCCGLRNVEEDGGARPAWKKLTHEEALEWAVKLLKPELSADARLFQRYWKLDVFERYVRQGLYDADFKDPYRGTGHAGLIRSFDNHFYDPTIGNNFYKNGWHAVCDGRRYFNLAVHTGRRMYQLKDNLPHDIVSMTGYYLGLSIHFLSDLTQPMHTANFANYLGEYGNESNDGKDKRHEGFEVAGDTWVPGKYAAHYGGNPLTPEDVRVDLIGEPGSYLERTARTYREVYRDYVAAIARSKRTRDNHGRWRLDNDWRQDEVDPAMRRSLLFLPKVLARYFALWASRIVREETLTHTKWYQIIASGGPLRLQYGEIHVGPRGDRSHESQFCFVFNRSGTWTVVCRADPSKAWCMETWPLRGSWLVARHGEDRSPRSEAQFRFVPIAPGNEDSFWIFERTFEANGDPEVIGLEDGTGPKIKRDRPTHFTSQVFSVSAVESVSPTEHDAVKAHWEEYGEYKWWGMGGGT